MSLYCENIEIDRPSHLGSTKWKLSNLSEITILLGKVGSGTSLLLRGIRDRNRSSCYHIAAERGVDLQRTSDTDSRAERGEHHGNNITNNFDGLFKSEALSKLRERYIGAKDAEKAALKDEIAKGVKTILPEIEIEIQQKGEIKFIRRSNKEIIGNAFSSGEAEILAIYLNILLQSIEWEQKGELIPKIITIDEPDLHIHQQQQYHLAKLLIDISSTYKIQLFIATHSLSLLYAICKLGGKKVGIIYVNNKLDNLEAQEINKYLEDLLIYLGDGIIIGPLLGKPILLVEGETDEEIFKKISRSKNNSFFVFSCNGDEMINYQKELEKLYGSLMEENEILGYALRDGDKKNGNNTSQGTQQYIKTIYLECKVIENLYLTNEVLTSLGLDWKKAKEKIKEKSVDYPTKSDTLNDCDKWNKDTNIKKVIIELEEILDLNGLKWTERVVRAIKNTQVKENNANDVRSLAAYLGNDLVNLILGDCYEKNIIYKYAR